SRFPVLLAMRLRLKQSTASAGSNGARPARKRILVSATQTLLRRIGWRRGRGRAVEGNSDKLLDGCAPVIFYADITSRHVAREHTLEPFDQTVPAVLHQVPVAKLPEEPAVAVDVGGDDRLAQDHGLEQHHRLSLVVGRQDETVRAPQQRERIPPEARQEDT